MPETTDPSTPTADPTGWCHWHKGPSNSAVLIEVIERASGPGAGLYACAPCREQRPLVPLGEQPPALRAAYFVHAEQHCGFCGVLVHGAIRRCGQGAQMWQAYQTALHTTAVTS